MIKTTFDNCTPWLAMPGIDEKQLPQLIGTDKQVDWARNIRKHFLKFWSPLTKLDASTIDDLSTGQLANEIFKIIDLGNNTDEQSWLRSSYSSEIGEIDYPENATGVLEAVQRGYQYAQQQNSAKFWIDHGRLTLKRFLDKLRHTTPDISELEMGIPLLPALEGSEIQIEQAQNIRNRFFTIWEIAHHVNTDDPEFDGSHEETIVQAFFDLQGKKFFAQELHSRLPMRHWYIAQLEELRSKSRNSTVGDFYQVFVLFLKYLQNETSAEFWIDNSDNDIGYIYFNLVLDNPNFLNSN